LLMLMPANTDTATTTSRPMMSSTFHFFFKLSAFSLLYQGRNRLRICSYCQRSSSTLAREQFFESS
jgi:hypothetical protein